MTELQRFEIAKERGWTYNPSTGELRSGTGKLQTDKLVKYSKKTNKIYAYIKCGLSIMNKNYGFRSHRFAYWFMTGELPEQIDHINHCEDPIYMNRFDNLRASNNSRNQFNRDDVKGYHKHHDKYRAYINVNNIRTIIGRFDTEEQAKNAYNEAKKIYHK
jgi:hypothetical protein